MTNQRISTLYIGVTNNLIRRVQEHRGRFYSSSFTVRYNLDRLVFYELFPTIVEAIAREKQLKKWTRLKKMQLILSMNPDLVDLWDATVRFW